MTSGGARALGGMFAMTDFMIPMVLDDLTEDQALARPRGEGGPSIAWSIGHLLHYRVFMLSRMGLERDNPFTELFGNTTATDGEGYPSVVVLRAAWTEISEEIAGAFDGVTENALDAVLDDGWDEGQTLRDLLLFFAWHEAYHLGAVGQLRKQMGLLSPSERVMEARSGG